MSSVGAGRRLRELRVKAGLTQEELAERSEISDRALRSLEAGTAKRPRPHTLRQLATALQLGDAEADELQALWDRRADPPSYAEFYNDQHPERAEFAALMAAQQQGMQTLSLYSRTTVDAGHRMSEKWSTKTVGVTSAGLDRCWSATQVDGFHWDVACLIPAAPRNATLGEVRYFPTIRIHAVELLFGRALEPGSSYSFGYGLDYREAATSRTETLGGVMDAISGPGFVLTQEVQFTPPELPTNIRQLVQPKIDMPVQETKPAALSAFGLVTAVFEPNRPGVYGLVWDWPDEEVSAAQSWPPKW